MQMCVVCAAAAERVSSFLLSRVYICTREEEELFPRAQAGSLFFSPSAEVPLTCTDARVVYRGE